MAATTNIRPTPPTSIAPRVVSTVERAASTPSASALRAPTHAARRVTTALRGADGRLAVICGA